MRTEQHGEVLVAFLEGELDHHAARQIREQLDVQLKRGGIKLCVLDFSGVSFMDSSGIGLIIGRYQLMEGLGGTLRLTNPTERVRRMMLLAGIQRLAEIETVS